MRPQPTSRMCFVCGRENPCGLKLKFYEDPENGTVQAEFVVLEMYQGYPGVVHGGVIAAILDEVAGRAVMLRKDHEAFMVTLRLTVRYRKPTPVGSLWSRWVGWSRSAAQGPKWRARSAFPTGR